MGAIIPPDELEPKVGSYFVPTHEIIHLADGRLHQAEVALAHLSQQVPGKEFSAVSDPAKGGVTFYWHPKYTPEQ